MTKITKVAIGRAEYWDVTSYDVQMQTTGINFIMLYYLPEFDSCLCEELREISNPNCGVYIEWLEFTGRQLDGKDGVGVKFLLKLESTDIQHMNSLV